MAQSTIYALASGRPPAAIAIVRVSGPLAHYAGRALAGTLPAARQAAVRSLRSPAGALLDKALLLRFDGPSSATGEDVVEFHCHGGRAVVDALLQALSCIDELFLAAPGEFTRRALENGRIDLTEAEGLADLLEAETESQRKAALLMAEGGLRRQIDQWNAKVLELSARAEVAIDYVDEDGIGLDPGLTLECGSLGEELDAWLVRPRAEPLREGIRVVVSGPPNSGKSSLINAIVGYEKAIVTDIPGTTRDEIEVAVSIGGIPFTFVDTAGLRDSDDPVEAIGIERARRAAARAEILLWLGDGNEALTHARPIAVHSRSDLPGREEVPVGRIAVSSVTGFGLDDLLRCIEALARQLLPAEGVVALNRRQAKELQQAREALQRASTAKDSVLVAEELRAARGSMDRLTGRAGVDAFLDQLFGRFCLGK